MPTQINMPENYQFGSDIHSCLKMFNVVSTTNTQVVVREAPDVVRARLSQIHPGLREDVADHTIIISPI